MSDAKRPGSRDISDLKQRLGLKKTGPTPAADAGGGAPAPSGRTSAIPTAPRQTGGVVPPPGLNLPPPPNMAPPSQPMPVIPNAADDPFGAMNAMAVQQTMQRAPEMIIVNDGKPVENVGQQSRGMVIAKIAVPAVVALFVGIAVGKRSQAANSFNEGLAGSKEILGNTSDRSKAAPSSVAGLKRVLSEIDSALEPRVATNFGYSAEADKALETLIGKLDLKSDAVFGKIKANSIPDVVAAEIVNFYAGVAELKTMVDLHTRAAKYDAMAFKKAKDKEAAAQAKEGDNAYLAGQIKYGVLLVGPSESTPGAEFGAKIVEIGPPYCGTAPNPASSGRCPDGETPSAFAYRAEPGGGWTKGTPAAPGETVGLNQLLLTQQGGVRDSLIQGADGVASEVYYKRRMRAIYERIHGKPDDRGGSVGGLLDQANKLETKLAAEASKGTQFTFFL